jgi:hypothetical protein
MKNIHVVHKSDSWAVEEEGKVDESMPFDTQEGAIEVAREMARRNKVELIVHAKDGTIRLRDSYGNDPRDVPG